MRTKEQSLKAETFRRLHQQSSTFVLPNAWDVISAKMFEECGFKAIGTTSAGIAASLGYLDGQSIPLRKMVETIENIAKSVKVPVSADIEAGYGQTVEEVLETVKAVVSAGAIGINLEDGTGDPKRPIFETSSQVEKIAAIKELSESRNMPLFINARTDLYWLNIGDSSTRLQEAVKRGKAYQDAGADCIFIPGLTDRKIIKMIREEISCPINLLVDPEMPSISELSEIGIERLSCGSVPFRATLTYLRTISEEIVNRQTFHHMTNGDVLSYRRLTEFIQ
ncbi:isocitrate lyase/phosphoenolpyruvate mutase family protein [Cytobacillus oceanisediminis]|uniref:isocitrate lyase/PEP mutase family protein n=1 Tax=Cytobacillus oceanisediminis TaxID=665099 RepID=UPI001FB4B058|nr:isocitrate lyase/phosphoenolpyruvate mutase family protein [Cytobacillus oceanisediminis]MDF2036298.1 isocitrate lyase/phosphoenolpyruvate mutase family protein [Cytobacillus oceanisediminis]UOE53627.1 isocitrate lyase/phosphoenolpyruvate mutase family protein [Cytobacillus oceanisediminis]